MLAALLLSTASITTLCTDPTPDEQLQLLDQGTYMVELYRNILDFCRSQENPSTILIAIPLDLIFAAGELPEEIQEQINSVSQAIESNNVSSLDHDAALKLINLLIPYMELVDAQIATMIQELQAIGVRMIAISPFMPQHAPAVLSRMQEVNLNFSTTALFSRDVTVDDESGNIVGVTKHGVLFLNDYFRASEALEILLRNTRTNIEHLIFAAPMADPGEAN